MLAKACHAFSYKQWEIMEAIYNIHDTTQYSVCKSIASVLFFNLWNSNSDKLSLTGSIFN